VTDPALPTHWASVGQPWRSEAEIGPRRQAVLARCRDTPHDPDRGAYPFRDPDGNPVLLTRADVEWLLATHPPEAHLDLRGATMRAVNVSDLPLAALVAHTWPAPLLTAPQSVVWLDGVDLTEAWLEHVDLRCAHLERAVLRGARLGGADLSHAHLSGADLRGADLTRACLRSARLAPWETPGDPTTRRKTDLTDATLDEATLNDADLRDVLFEDASLVIATFHGAMLYGARFVRATLPGADFGTSHFQPADPLMKGDVSGRRGTDDAAAFQGARLQGARFPTLSLQGVTFRDALLAGATFNGARLEGARFERAHVEGTFLSVEDVSEQNLERLRRTQPDFSRACGAADLRGATFDATTALDGAIMGDKRYGSVLVLNARWGDAALDLARWDAVAELGDERLARRHGTGDLSHVRLARYRDAVRANRQIAVALRERGMAPEAARFAYRARSLETDMLGLRVRWRSPSSWPRYLASRVVLRWIAGYGLKPGRTIIWYLGIISSFAAADFVLRLPLGQHDALAPTIVLSVVESLYAFHGRGLASIGDPTDPRVTLGALEAVLGLLLEVVFIAAFTRRFFNDE